MAWFILNEQSLATLPYIHSKNAALIVSSFSQDFCLPSPYIILITLVDFWQKLVKEHKFLEFESGLPRNCLWMQSRYTSLLTVTLSNNQRRCRSFLQRREHESMLHFPEMGSHVSSDLIGGEQPSWAQWANHRPAFIRGLGAFGKQQTWQSYTWSWKAVRTRPTISNQQNMFKTWCIHL